MTGKERGNPAMPALLSTKQLEAIVNEIRTRREQVQALRAQLQLFDEQLAVLEASLLPLLEWSRTWAGMEQAMLDFWRLPGSGRSKES